PPAFNRNNRYNDVGVYAMDSWKVMPRFTFNYGIRWEYYGPQHNVDQNLDSNFYLGTGATRFDQIRNGFVATVPNSPIGSLWEAKYRNFAPRVGFAYDVFGDGKTSIRGGFGISYERNFGNVTFNVIQNPPNYAVLAIVNGVDVPAGTVPITPNNTGPLSGTGSKALGAVSLRAVDQKIDPAYSEFWSLAAEREIARNTLLSIAYTGSKGVHLYDIANINRPGGGGVIEGDALSGNRLLPQYGDINFRGSNGFSNYNAVNIGLRSANIHNTGLQFSVNYTWAHAIDNLSSTFSESFNNFNLGYLDAFNPALDKGAADFDVRHRVAISGIWDVPFFKNSQNKIEKNVLGGWEFAPIFTARTGIPYSIYDCTNGNQVCLRWLPATPISTSGSVTPVGPNTFDYIDMASAGSLTSSYANPIVGISDWPTCTGLQYQGCSFPAMLGKDAWKGPNNWTFDLGIYKNFKVTERVGLQFRGELYNIFNHHNYYVVDDAADFSTATTIQVKKGGAYPGATNQLTQTGSDERRFVQFALKVTF
ncbi:MAG TPA: hypothetical protein VK473_10715, partial [Terriglobales bacterium]|nr:hypothetical protein [Terriglobales bacterium]